MPKAAIRVENLSKRYDIASVRQRHDTLRDQIAHRVLSLFRNGSSSRSQPFWALKEVSFEVLRGEVLGIIGRNGAGKSTLLKVLSRITEPTAGRVKIYGKVASLLEVGTGFVGELTGRENVYLNGAILGMRKAEIDRKFDEIVDFSGVGEFIDTPVKRYSSGMHVRLAFGVAAHLEPDVLIVDEVLAVGDVSFQKKCLARMETVAKQGRTVLFVSHNMQAVTRLCERTILLDEGKILVDGPSHRTVSAYLTSGLGTTAARDWPAPSMAPGDDVVRLVSVRVHGEDGKTTDAVDIRRSVGIEIEYEILQPGYEFMLYFNCFNEEGVHAVEACDQDPEWRRRKRMAGKYVSTGWIPGNLLAEGTVFVEVGIYTANPYSCRVNERDVVAFQIIDSIDGDSARGDWPGSMSGIIRPLLKWTTSLRPHLTERVDNRY